ncbi:MAG: 23S rRNA (adenine(2503)-C(2))-methyltransferase RlmN [Lachnospiraceae bacterium]|nr:23S rRNA (adenine(2503)-C(2))-methyltransferase RlmN [Lachnospiraceae bacterium]
MDKKKNTETADLRSMTGSELSDFFADLGEPAFRAKQVFSWIHEKGAFSWEEMTNLSKNLREKLKREAPLNDVRVERMQESRIDGTRKYLFALSDGNLIESVLMRYRFGNSVCVSSQAGCRMGCRFCASTVNGVARDLTAGEMLAQVYAIERELGKGERVSHVVVMGSGEPMENYDAVIRFFRLLADEKGKHLSFRNMTVSTCGIVPGIRRLAGEGIPVNLALSLHAPNDEIRKTLMPIARKYGMDEVLAACGDYFAATGRRLTWEYALVRGINDSPEHARELAERIRAYNGVVNLIPVNPVTESGLKEPSGESVRRFQEALKENGAEATIRRTLGRDIDGACGQLRKRVMQGEKPIGDL